MAAARYTWMFRAAAVVFLLFGGFAIWRYGLTQYDPAHRLWGVGFGLFAALVGIFLFRGSRLAITLSAIAAALIAICATLGVPMVNGPPGTRTSAGPVNSGAGSGSGAVRTWGPLRS